MHNLQKNIFQASEADNWFKRNIEEIEKYHIKNDLVTSAIQLNSIIPQKVLEIGCSNGFRLKKLKDLYNCQAHGIEPSVEAINYAKIHYPEIIINEGTTDNLEIYQDNYFDLVIINFVLHWVDRNLLFKTFAEMDRLLCNEGILIIGDFSPLHPIKNKYHHLPDQNIYTFKQNYYHIFVESQIYDLIYQSSFEHDTLKLGVVENPDAKCSISVLKKNLLIKYI